MIDRFGEVFGPQGSGVPPGMSQEYLTTPPDRCPWFIARDSAALLGVAILAGMLAAVVIGSRRPA